MPRSGRSSLAVLSNRGPVSFAHDGAGGFHAKRASGGLVAVLGPGAVESDAVWLATALTDADRAATATGEVLAEGHRFRSLSIDPSRFRQYYNVIANQTLWFLVHGLWDLPRRPRFDRHWRAAWASFVAVNRQFAEAAAAELAPGATVLIHDYQLALVGGELRRLRPDVRSCFFLHTPFCPPNELEVLPTAVADTLLTGMSGAGACGFHSPRWARNFEACCAELRIDAPAVFVSPAAVDAEGLATVAASPECAAALKNLDALIGDRLFIMRTDRIELSKNLLRGFHAFDDLLAAEPAWRGRVIFGAFVYPSRDSLADYLGYRQEVEAVVRAINAKWATSDWTPILLDMADDYPRSVAALRRYDVLMVNPIRDGLNLVAKEGPLVNERHGVLLLSPGAGAWDELGSHALEAHPFDVAGLADTLAVALTMPADERASRAQALKKVAGSRTPIDWFAEQVGHACLPRT